MPQPIPIPTAEEIVIVAEITMLSVATVAEMIAADTDQDVSNAKWGRTLDNIDSWDEIRDESGDIKKVGSIEFFEGKAISTRLDFRNMVRGRYGQSLLFTKGATCTNRRSSSVPIEIVW